MQASDSLGADPTRASAAAAAIGSVIVEVAALAALNTLDCGATGMRDALAEALSRTEGGTGVPLIERARQVLAAG